MAGNYTATTPLEVIDRLRMGTFSPKFDTDQFKAYGNFETLRMFMDNSPLWCNPAIIDDIKRQRQSQDQPMYKDFWNFTPFVGDNTRSTSFTANGLDTGSYQMQERDKIRHFFDISGANEQNRRRMQGLSAEDAFEQGVAANILGAVFSMLRDLEADAQAYVDTLKATAGGNAAIPDWTTTGDYRIIPDYNDPQNLFKLISELKKNLIIRTENENCNLLFDAIGGHQTMNLLSQGEANNANYAPVASKFVPYYADQLEVTDELLYSGIMYAITRGGIGMFTYAQDFGAGTEKRKGKSIAKIALPDLVPSFPVLQDIVGGLDFSAIELEIFQDDDIIDNSANYGGNEFYGTDPTMRWSMLTTPIFARTANTQNVCVAYQIAI